MRLSDFQDEEAVEIVARLLEPLGAIASNAQNAQARQQGTAAFAAALLRNNRRQVLEIFAVLNGQEPADYHCTAASLLKDALELLSDPALQALFGLQSKTPASSGSASRTSGAPAKA